MKKKTGKQRAAGIRSYAFGGEEPVNDKYYRHSAVLGYYKGLLNDKLKAKNPKGYGDYFKGLVDLRRSGDEAGASKYIQETPFDDYLSPKDVQTTLGENGYKRYLESLKGVNEYNVAQGKMPLYGTTEGEKGVDSLNFGRRFASLQVNPSVAVTQKDERGNSKKYSREYTYDPATDAVNFTEAGDLSIRPSYLGAKDTAKFATGGVAGAADGLGGYGGLIQQIPGIADAIINIAENNPNAYSKEPTVNVSTMRGMQSPYKNFATGGEVGIGDLDEDQIEQLQQIADQNGVTIEDLVEMYQKQQAEGQEEEAEGEEEEMEDEEPIEEGDDVGTENMFGYGGTSGKRKINVEGGEVMETPSGVVKKISGKKHEQGGVNVKVPAGTKIYSDRLKIDGESMEERKLKREKTLKRLEKLTASDPTSQLLKNTVARTSETVASEEAKDMAIQQIAGQIYDTPGFAWGGQSGGPLVDQYDEYGNPIPKYDINALRTSVRLSEAGNATGKPNVNPNVVNNFQTPVADQAPTTPAGAAGTSPQGFTTGDWIGMAGNAFNAIAPIINTVKNAKSNKPNVNRFKKFGKAALDTNTAMQDLLATTKAGELTDIDTASNSARMRGNNSASSVNTARALGIANTIGTNKAKRQATDGYTKSLIGVLGQRTGLENARDQVVMRGEAARDMEDKADNDNFYSNLAQNLTNFGSNVQGIGKAVNVNKSNQVDANLISQLSQYGLSFDKDGKLISKK